MDEVACVGDDPVITLETSADCIAVPGSTIVGIDDVQVDAVKTRSSDASHADGACLVVGSECLVVGSDSESSSSSSSGPSRSRSRSRGNKRLGAAAGAALVTAAEPLDVDACDKLTERDEVFPSEFAVQLQHDGTIVAIMAEAGVVITMSPQPNDVSTSCLRIAGTEAAVGRVTWQLQRLHEAHRRRVAAEAEAEAFAAEMECLEELPIPAEHVSAVVGNNGCDLPAIRDRCGGIMLALCPPAEPGGPLMACAGPGDRQQVRRAISELRARLEAAATAAAKAKEV